MKVEIRSSFAKAAKKLPSLLQNSITIIIMQLENASSIRDVSNCKKMTGYKTAYRIKLQDYRIGMFYEKGIVELTTIMHRKDIYNHFP